MLEAQLGTHNGVEVFQGGNTQHFVPCGVVVLLQPGNPCIGSRSRAGEGAAFLRGTKFPHLHGGNGRVGRTYRNAVGLRKEAHLVAGTALKIDGAEGNVELCGARRGTLRRVVEGVGVSR